MQLEDRHDGNILIVKVLNNRMDAKSVDDFLDKMSEHITNGERFIVLSLSDVDFIDSSGLGAIVSVLKQLKGHGKLVISGAGESIIRMFKLTRMNKVFNMFVNEKGAVEALLEEKNDV